MRSLSLLVTILFAGCSFFSVETEIPEVCMSFHDRLIEGVDPGETYERSFVGDPLSALMPFVELDAEITEARATLTARRGVSDLAFLESVSVIMRPEHPAAKTASVSLVDCAHFACASMTQESTLVEAPSQGALEVVKAGPVEIDVVLGGVLPEHDWVVDLELCVAGRARASLSL